MFSRIGIAIFAIVATLLGLILAAGGLLGALGGDRTAARFLTSTAAVPAGIMLLELGVAAAWLALRASRGGVAPAVTLPPWWASALAFVAAIGAGWLALRIGQWWLFLPFATLAVFAPVAAAGRLGLPSRGPRPSWRRLLPAFAWGALVTPVLAIALQLIAAVGAVAAAVVGVMTSGQDQIAVLQQLVQRLQGRTLSGPQEQALLQLAARQPVVLAVGAFVLVFAGPVTEELGKFGATLLFGRPRRGTAPFSALTVFLIGLAAGLGFAATENIFYAAQAGPGGWTALIVTRGATPVMHGTASALFALGWARQQQAPGGWGLLRGALAAIGLHAAWNLCAGLLIVALLFVPGGGTAGAFAAVLMVLAFATLAILGLGSVAVLLRLRRTLADEAAATPVARGGAAAPLPHGPAEPMPNAWDRHLAQPTPGGGERQAQVVGIADH